MEFSLKTDDFLLKSGRSFCNLRYRKHFTLPSSFGAGGETWLHFEGVFQAVDVFLNGEWVLRHTSGYLGFDVPLHTGIHAYIDRLK